MRDNFVIAKYIRLSLEDAKSDSMSIENQSLLIDMFIAGMEIAPTSVIEFVDNGHSGMNFERPAVQEMLELVRMGQINCIIVKDLSRFGREMIDTGYYLERVFPLYRVRLISVSDNYDSNDYEGSTGGLEVAFKHLIHEQYSLDLSRKIKAAKHSKALRGEFVTKNCVFGYKKVGKKLEIDEAAAETVRYIFKLSVDGNGLTQIAKKLYDEKHSTPSEYRHISKKNKERHKVPCLWVSSAILSILTNEQYIGTYVTGKARSVEVGSKKTESVPSSEWIRIPNHHPPIVEKAVFDAVQIKIEQNRNNRRSSNLSHKRATISPLKSKVICGCCRHKMALSSTRNAAFHCGFTRAAIDADCHMLRKSVAELESEVLREIHRQLHDITTLESTQVTTNTCTGESLARAGDAKRALYESLMLGEIDVDEYRQKSAEYDEWYQFPADNSHANAKQPAALDGYASLHKLAADTLKENKLTKQAVDGFIDTVKVYPSGSIEIVWNIPGLVAQNIKGAKA
ncbi:MAG: recombinase family protein [Oscillospiraceae bacterium]|nr:recombinase family protein [Oscillospiraceae bacterium]MCL2279530.1 recombinase family protein [Oscillospiraceae bacterium]